jgi:serine/threonine protein kinase
MSNGPNIGQLAYQYLQHRFNGDLAECNRLQNLHESLPGFLEAVEQARDAHKDYLNQVLGDYRLDEFIGRGGFGEVYSGENLPSKKSLAIKVVSNKHITEKQAIELCSNLPAHDRLVSLHHVGQTGTPYFYYTMDLADNLNQKKGFLPKSLANFLGRLKTHPKQNEADRWSILSETAFDVGIAIAQALQCLHGNSHVHRDVKPHNILCFGGSWKLGDIGLLTCAKDLQDSKMPSGTQRYFPPKGHGSDFATLKKSDVYALGLTLFQTITCGEENLERFKQKVRFSTELPKILRPLGDVVKRVCAFEPKRRRFQSADDILEALEKARRPGLLGRISSFF